MNLIRYEEQSALGAAPANEFLHIVGKHNLIVACTKRTREGDRKGPCK